MRDISHLFVGRLNPVNCREARLEELLRSCLVELYRRDAASTLREEIETELARKEGSGY